jgi:eukaryotic-like serine/threonine-protein kinase
VTPERWREVEQVYQSTMDREPRLRAAFLSEACGSDQELRREVDSLLELNHSPVLVDAPAWQAVAELLTENSQLAPGTQLGPYRIEAMLGAGGMGTVYQSQDTRLGRSVALKISRVEFNERFEREARAVAALNHPNICTIHDVGPNYLVMELVDGPTLSDRMKEGAIPLDEALRIARQIADALEAAHEKGIVHRDLKPGNIKIKPDGTVKVLDFGLAKICDPVAGRQDPENSPTLTLDGTRAGMILGTAAYMSPEQARGELVDQRADIWAFGVVLYEMLAGRRIFDARTIPDTLAAVLIKEPELDRVPAQIRPLLRRCLAKEPKQRLHHIADARLLLEEAEAPPAISPLPSRRGRFPMAAAAVFGLAFAALAFIHFTQKPPAAETIRFQISPPDKGNFSGNDSANVSPDGRRIAFQLRRPDGVRQLWVRSLDSLESKPLAGTEGVVNASVWSPDSRFIAFSVEGKLKKVDTSGGAARTLCDLPWMDRTGETPPMRAGAWNRDGVILFGTAASGMWRVPDKGGVPSPVTTLDISRKETFHGAPSFLPDGRHFVYNRIAPSEDHNGVYVGSLDAKPEQQSSKRLLAGSANAAYAPDPNAGPNTGYVLFTREGSLMAQTLDLRKLELTGEAVPIAGGMGNGAPRPFSASTTGVLAYREGFAGGGRAVTQLIWFDRAGKPMATVGDPGTYNAVALSRDGTRVATGRVTPRPVREQGSRPPADIWVHEFARDIWTRLTSDPAIDWLPATAWSPDGSRIIFSSERDGGVHNLYQKLASGAGNEELLVKSSQDKSVQDWSPDGRSVLYSAVVGGRGDRFTTSNNDLWFLPLTPSGTAGAAAGGKPEVYLKTEFNENQGQFSPDGRFIAYCSNASGRDEIYVRPFPKATDGQWTISKGGGLAPRWSGDGKELFYISADLKMMAVDVTMSPVFKPGIAKPLFQTSIAGGATARRVFGYDVRADGKRFLINSAMADTGPVAATTITVITNWTALLKK